MQRARERMADAAAGRPGAAELEAVLERAREQIEALAAAAAELQEALPERVGEAVREGLRAEARPLSQRVAEIRGLSNQTIRRLERIETDLTAERHARVDDFGLLVDLVVSGWRSLDERLRRVEQALASDRPATVHRLQERRGA